MSEQDVTLDEFIEEEQSSGNGNRKVRLGPVTAVFPEDWDVQRMDSLYREKSIGTNERGTGKHESIPLIKMGDLERREVAIRNPGEEIERTNELLDECGLEKGDLLFNTRNTPDLVGKTAIWDSSRPAVYDNNLLRVRFKSDISSFFVNYFLSSEIGWRQARGHVHGTTSVAAIYDSEFDKLQIPVPESEEQRKITSVLYNVDQAIQKTKEIIEQMDIAQQGLLRSLFGKGGTRQDTERETKIERLGPKQFKVPVTWSVTDISSIGQVVTGDTPSTDNETNFGGNLPFVTPETLSQGKYVTKSERTLSESGREEAKPIPEGSVMMDCIGSDMGKVAIADREVATNQQINSVVIEDSEYLPEFLYYHLRVLSDFIKSQAGQTATPIVNKSSFESFAIFKPPIKEQHDITDTLSMYDEGRRVNSEYFTELTHLKQGLMQDLLSGKVRTTDTNIEVVDEVAQYG